MKKIITLCVLAAFSLANAQEQSTIDTNKIDATVSENVIAYKKTLQDKIDAVKRAVINGVISKEEGDKIITKFESAKIDALTSTIEYAVDIESIDWSAYEWLDGSDVVDEEVVFDEVEYADEESTSSHQLTKDVVKNIWSFKQTGFVFSGAFANLANQGSFANSEFSYGRSNNMEWGIMSRIPFSKENSNVGLKYGLTFNYYQLHTTNNRVFVKEGKDLVMETFPYNLKKNKSFLRNTYITLPIMIDFDFSKQHFDDVKGQFVKRNGFKMALGGYLGYNINSKQFIRYKNEYGHIVKEKQKGEWNATNFQYGLQASVGYGNVHIVGKYDLNNMFKENPKGLNFWSLGLRIELLK